MIYLQLFAEFFKIGLFSIGGGLATLPFLQELVETRGWITASQLLDMIAVSESTPGPLGINTATFVGNAAAGVFGGVVAILGIVAPSIVIIVLIARSLSAFGDHPLVKGAFSGVRPTVAGLIGAVALQLGQTELLNLGQWGTGSPLEWLNFRAVVLFAGVLVLASTTRWHPVLLLAGAAVLGVVFRF